MKLYDENEAVSFILQETAGECGIDKDAVLCILDAMYDHYDETGDLELDFDEDTDEEDDEDIDRTVSVVAGKTGIDETTVRKVLIAEHRYQDSLL